MIARRTLLAQGLATGLALAAARPAFAIDPGVSSGKYEREDEKISFSHAIALSTDNVEGVSERKHEFRVLLSDREVPLSAILGLMFPPVWTMAREGKLNGLLLEFDPADRTSLNVVALTKRDDGFSPASVSLTNSEGLWSKLDVSATRISGELKPDASESMRFKFSAPVFTNAVTADLKGAAAAASEPVKVLLARAEALGKGDMATVDALSTEGSRVGSLPPEVLKMAKAQMPALIRQLKATKRVVIREQTAAIMLGSDGWGSATLVGGVWKAAD